MAEIFHRTEIESPLGTLVGIASSRGLCGLEFSKEDRLTMLSARLRKHYPDGEVVDRQCEVLRAVAASIIGYFHGTLDQLSDLPLDLMGTDFERSVWSGLAAITAGEVMTYGELAKSIGYEGCARAVGGAVGRNPIGIVVPCHRIIGSTGVLTGYGGGLDRKRWLLDHEGFKVSGTTRHSLVERHDSTRAAIQVQMSWSESQSTSCSVSKC